MLFNILEGRVAPQNPLFPYICGFESHRLHQVFLYVFPRDYFYFYRQTLGIDTLAGQSPFASL